MGMYECQPFGAANADQPPTPSATLHQVCRTSPCEWGSSHQEPVPACDRCLISKLHCQCEIAGKPALVATGQRADVCCSWPYAAPEVLAAVHHNCRLMIAKTSADMFPLGLIAYELLTGERVFPPGTAPADIKQQLLGHARLPWERVDATARLKMLQGFKRPILQCLERQPANRPTAAQVVRAWSNLFAQVTKESTSRTEPVPR